MPANKVLVVFRLHQEVKVQSQQELYLDTVQLDQGQPADLGPAKDKQQLVAR